MKILVAIDSTESSHRALQQALQLLTHEGATLILLSIEEPVILPSTASVPGLMGGDSMVEWQEEAELSQLAEQRANRSLEWAEGVCQQAGVQYSSRLEMGDPKHVICGVAKQEGCELIVVGSHGYGVLERALLGSVSDHVVHHAPCAVLVVRE